MRKYCRGTLVRHEDVEGLCWSMEKFRDDVGAWRSKEYFMWHGERTQLQIMEDHLYCNIEVKKSG